MESPPRSGVDGISFTVHPFGPSQSSDPTRTAGISSENTLTWSSSCPDAWIARRRCWTAPAVSPQACGASAAAGGSKPPGWRLDRPSRSRPVAVAAPGARHCCVASEQASPLAAAAPWNGGAPLLSEQAWPAQMGLFLLNSRRACSSEEAQAQHCLCASQRQCHSVKRSELRHDLEDSHGWQMRMQLPDAEGNMSPPRQQSADHPVPKRQSQRMDASSNPPRLRRRGRPPSTHGDDGGSQP